MSDLPPPWVWAWLSKRADNPPTAAMIKTLSSSQLPVRNIRMFATGIPDSQPIDEQLAEKSVMAAYMTECAKRRGNVLNKGKGFFQQAVTKEGIVFAGEHGCFQFVADDEKKEAAHLILCNVKRLVVNLKESGWSSVTFPMDCKIEKNYDEVQAYVLVLGRKILLHTLFKNFVKVKYDEIAQDIELFTTECYADNTHEVEPDIADAAKRRRKAPTAPPPVVKRDRKRTADNATEAKFDLSVVHCASFSEKGVPDHGHEARFPGFSLPPYRCVLDVVFKLLPERGSANLGFFLTAWVSGNVSRFARVLNVFVSVI